MLRREAPWFVEGRAFILYDEAVGVSEKYFHRGLGRQ